MSLCKHACIYVPFNRFAYHSSLPFNLFVYHSSMKRHHDEQFMHNTIEFANPKNFVDDLKFKVIQACF